MKDYDPDRFRAGVDARVAGLPAGTVVGDVPWFIHGGTGHKSGEAAGYVPRLPPPAACPSPGCTGPWSNEAGSAC